jgi:hypothetical protein
MVCHYCGLESDEATNHGSPEDCIHALERELARLRRMVETATTPVEPQGRRPPARDGSGERRLRAGS